MPSVESRRSDGPWAELKQNAGWTDQKAAGDARVGCKRVQDCYETCCSVHVVIVQADQDSVVHCLSIKEIHV